MKNTVNLLQKTRSITFGIDASSANKKNRTGVEQYAFHLIEAMKKQPLKEGERVFLYSNSPLGGELLGKLPKGWESKVLDWKLKSGWMQGRVSWEMFKRPPSVMFVPSQGLPRIGKNLVTTIHDIGFKRVPKLYDPKVRKRLLKITKRSINKAKKIIAVSKFTSQELQEVYHVKPEKIRIIYNACDTNAFHKMKEAEMMPTLQKYRLGRNFFFSIGRLEKKKNTAMLIRSFEAFKQGRGLGDPYQLVIAGDPGFGYEEIKKYVELSEVKDQIKILPRPSDEEVAVLMSAAVALVFPSWYEGFGIPNLEAMACGTPLITSDIPVHKEIVQDAAIFVLPGEPESWARAMRQLVQDTRIRTEIVNKGLERVKDFSWDKSASQTWELLRSLV